MAKTRKVMKVKQPAADSSSKKDDVFDVEKIIDKREDPSEGLMYYVKWKGYPSTSNTWEPAENILQPNLIKNFDRQQAALAKKASSKKAPELSEEEAELDNEDEGEGEEEEEGEDHEDEDHEKEDEEEEEPVKPKRARTTSKTVSKTAKPTKSAPKSKAQPKSKIAAADAEPAKTVVKVKMTRRIEPKAKPTAGTRTKPTTTAQDKPKAAEPRKAPSRRNVPVKTDPIEDFLEGEGFVEEDLLVVNLESKTLEEDEEIKDDVKDATVVVAAADIPEMNLANFKVTRRINDSVTSKMITFLGTYKGDDAVIRLERRVFEEDAVKAVFKDKNTFFERNFFNDVYSRYELKPSDSSSLNSITATVVCPADSSVLAKYTRDEAILFSESADVYSKVVEPYIDGVLKNKKTDPNRWLYNILDGLLEQDRVIADDPDPDSGFMLIPDLKWSGNEEDLHIVAICRRRDIRSLRDLTDKHMVLLKNIMTKGTQAIKDKYPNLNGQLRSYIHYQPSFYHFHVHFRVVNASEYAASDRDNLLGTVINNINMKKDYYKKASLTYPLSKSHPLYQELVKAERL